MPIITRSRVPFTPQNPYRTVRPTTDKIIFLSCEGAVTEEEYFARVSEIFSAVKNKIQFISVAEDAVHTKADSRTAEQNALLSKVRPLQLVERIDKFKEEEDKKYQFDQYPEDEFWIVTDVDKNWSDEFVSPNSPKTFIEEWNEAIDACSQKGYRYAVSNPFFEVWLLLHHDTANEDDCRYAVTATHPYEPTDQFKTRLSELDAKLIGNSEKQIRESDYTEKKIRAAVERAEKLHIDKEDLCPHYLATTVYMLLQKILEMLPESTSV